MNITLIPDHEVYIETRIQNGVYQNVDELMNCAIALLIESEIEPEEEGDLIHDRVWIESTRHKVTSAIDSLKSNGGTNGEVAIAQLLDRYRQRRDS